ncbi:MAG TPA: hypothetical protein VFB38_12360 [Chthonomonadaceae bacterium]|nr:hypothetical protein [Chthonomonadaceae bacterium]
MAQPAYTAPTGVAPVSAPVARTDNPAYRAYQLLHIGFTLAPIIAGLDKFFLILANWDNYLAPIIPQTLHVQPHMFMMAVGIIEIIAGLIVAIKPRIGGYVVAVWLWGIIINLFLVPGIIGHQGHTWGLDLALRDFGLSLGALALAWLGAMFDRPAAPAA